MSDDGRRAGALRGGFGGNEEGRFVRGLGGGGVNLQ